MPAKALKAADKQTILKKLVAEMKRRFGNSTPKQNLPTFETLLFAICLEDSNHSEAEAAYNRLLDSFFDLNEIRVSSVSEIESALGDLTNADWKAMRIREVLQHTFEKYYSFDLEALKRKTQDVALKELSQIPHHTPFVRNYVVQHALGAHVLSIDTSINNLLIWLGLSSQGSSVDATSEDLRSAIKKADGAQICHLFKCLSTDPAVREFFAEVPEDIESIDPFSATERLVDLYKNGHKRAAAKAKKAVKAVNLKKPAKKAVARTAAAKPAATKKAAAKVTKKKPLPKEKPRRRTK